MTPHKPFGTGTVRAWKRLLETGGQAIFAERFRWRGVVWGQCTIRKVATQCIRCGADLAVGRNVFAPLIGPLGGYRRDFHNPDRLCLDCARRIERTGESGEG